MKTLESIIEDPNGNVVGAMTNDGTVLLPAEAHFPRSQLMGKARELSAAFGVTIPAAIEAKLPPVQNPG